MVSGYCPTRPRIAADFLGFRNRRARGVTLGFRGRQGRRRVSLVAIGKDGAALRQLRTLFNVGAIRELTDGQLLERFATGRGEAAELAFAALVERHGPMVLRVCRGVLADPHDAQDAFQATFLVLVRKARALWVRDSLGPWLHQVAYRTASWARSAAARRRRHERRAAGSPAQGASRDRRRADPRAPRGDRPAPRALPGAGGPLRPRGADPRAGGPAPGLAGRDGQEPAARGPASGSATGSPAAASPRTPAGSPRLAPIPPALVDVTAGAAVRSSRPGRSSRVPPPPRPGSPSIHDLPPMVEGRLGPPRPRRDHLRRRPARPGAGRPNAARAAASGPTTPPTVKVKPGKLRVTVAETGSRRGVAGRGRAQRGRGHDDDHHDPARGDEGQEGRCRLRARLGDAQGHSSSTRRSPSSRPRPTYKNAKLTREVAEIAVKEYDEGIYKQEREALDGEIAQAAVGHPEGRGPAGADPARPQAAGRAEGPGRARRPPTASWPTSTRRPLDDAEQALTREQAALELAKTRLETAREDTPRTGRSGSSTAEVEQARADELAKQATWELEKSKEAKLERQIKACVLLAPADGVVVYANDPAGRGQPQIEEGATVRERQKIFSVFDLDGPMRVNAKVARVDGRPGQAGASGPGSRSTRSPNETLTGDGRGRGPAARRRTTSSGRVGSSTPPGSRSRRARQGLRPGMTAEVEILVIELDDVLSVPVACRGPLRRQGPRRGEDARGRVRLARGDPRREPTTSHRGQAGAQGRRGRGARTRSP